MVAMARAPALEPVDEGEIEREEAAHAGAGGGDEERQVELQQRVDERKQHEAAAEQRDADAHHAARAEAVQAPAQHRPQDRRFHLVQRRGAGELGLGPAAIVAQDGEVGAEGLVQQAGLQELQPGAGGDQPPAAEDAFQGLHAGRSGRRGGFANRKKNEPSPASTASSVKPAR
jgi:hypothetical protein